MNFVIGTTNKFSFIKKVQDKKTTRWIFSQDQVQHPKKIHHSVLPRHETFYNNLRKTSLFEKVSWNCAKLVDNGYSNEYSSAKMKVFEKPLLGAEFIVTGRQLGQKTYGLFDNFCGSITTKALSRLWRLCWKRLHSSRVREIKVSILNVIYAITQPHVCTVVLVHKFILPQGPTMFVRENCEHTVSGPSIVFW